MIAPKPRDEERRLRALEEYHILDTPPEPAFDDIARLAAHICQTPIAVINFIDRDRQWFKAEVGLGTRETPLLPSICAHAILQDDLVLVHDTLADDRFRDNPFVVGTPHLRFYAGAVISSHDGQPIGTMCVLDYVPREMTKEQAFALQALARQVMAQLELRRKFDEQERTFAEFRRLQRQVMLQGAIAQLLADSESVSDATRRTMERVARTFHWDIAVFWERDWSTNVMVAREFWTESQRVEPFERATRGSVFKSGEGLPGAVWQMGGPFWIEELPAAKIFARASVASHCGLRSGVGFPVTTGGKIYGVFEFFSFARRAEDPELAEVVKLVGQQFGQFWYRRAAEGEVLRVGRIKSAVLEVALDAVITMNHLGRVVEFNPAAEKLFGYEREKALGKEMAELIIPPELRERHRQGLTRYLETGEGPVLRRRIEVPAMRADGTTFPAELAIIPIPEMKPPLFTGFLRDVTERKQHEAALREANESIRQHAEQLEIRVAERTAQLQRSYSALQTFSYSMAHDLRAPLRAMQGFSRALLDEFEAGFPPEARDYFRRIMSAAERMDRLINDLLQFVRVSGSPVAPVPVNPRDVLMNVLRDVNSNIHQAGATVDVQVSEEPVLATEMLLQQIFTNFVTNGLKFVRPGVPPRLTIRSEPVDDGTRILFEDNGIGIAIEHQHRIFQLFQRLHTEAEFAGTGIGLAFVKQAAERIGAEVGMSSEAGAGSKFWIDLQRPAEKSAGQGG